MGEEEDANSRLMTRKRKLGGRVMRASQTFMPGEVVLMRAVTDTRPGRTDIDVEALRWRMRRVRSDSVRRREPLQLECCWTCGSQVTEDDCREWCRNGI